ncbi:FAD-binding oxidoreductase [Phytohabitans suffuscus]|uniref:Alkyldihydroxyacetonephosphate synthase n=1 Tax=Phytohabitans suffuscus TaxID=624315 RepID=A0A6F8YYJ2_9ACTN|nr:FAD-binding oxidoreductase [Phytohabitans suffuscus]BCB91149.1 alkyldihydroxyacetonephosphate synthase [Phytohabitans suffuscus]
MPAVADRLRAALGEAAVSTSEPDLDARSHDTWPVATVWARLGRHPYRPEVVVRARGVDDVVATLRVAAEAGVPVTAWGLGSSVTGQPLPVGGGIVLDMSGHVSAPVLDETDRTVRVAAGVRGGDLEAWLAERGLTLNHSPQSLGRSTVGGWVATRATGQFSSRYGGIEDLVVGYQVVLADGTVADVGQRPRAAMGPDLRAVFIGSEGTLGVVTEVTLKVYAAAPHRIVEAFALPGVEAGLTAMRRIAQAGLRPFLVRFYDDEEAAHAVPGQPVAAPVLFLGHEGLAGVATAEHTAATGIVEALGGTSMGAPPVTAWLGRRYDFSTIERRLAEPGGYAETIEVAHLWSRIGPMYRDLKDQLAPLADEVLGHFSHVYEQGSSLYVILLGRAADDRAALARLEEIWDRAMKVVVAHGGEVSHHHGGGLARQPWVRRSLGSGYPVLERLKGGLDPAHLLNPGKLGFGPDPRWTSA